MKVIIRADASTQIGTGHVMRCIALGQALLDHDASVEFVTRADSPILLDRLVREGFEVQRISKNHTVEQELSLLLSKADADWIVLDGYHFDTSYQMRLRDQRRRVLCIDDIANFPYVSNLVLNQNLNADRVFHYDTSDYTRLLLGTRYALLRREFRQAAQWSRTINQNCKNILVFMGGGDPFNYTLKCLRSLNTLSTLRICVRAVLGATFSFRNEIEQFVAESKFQLEILSTQESLIDLIQWCDLAIVAAGSTVWEMASLKTPMAVAIVADNQIRIAEQLENEAAAINLGWMDQIQELELGKKLSLIMNSTDLRQTLSREAARICDGVGAERVAKEMLK